MVQPEDPIKTKTEEEKKIAFNEMKHRERIDELYTIARSNTVDTIAIIILFVGILLSIYNTFYGGLLIGIVAGYYFAEVVIALSKDFQFYVEKMGVIHTLILGGLILGLFIATPAIFIGAAAAMGIKFIVNAIRK